MSPIAHQYWLKNLTYKNKTMANIVVNDLHHTDVTVFLDDLKIGEVDTILGGFIQSLLGGYSDNVLLTSIYDAVNQRSNSTNSLADVDDNKLFTADFSEIAFNLIVV
jgi:hypothetical protein